MPKTNYGVPPIPSVVPSLVSTFTYGIPHSLSVVPPSVLASECDIPSPGVQPLSMLPPQVGSQPARFIISLVVVDLIMSFKDQKRFERFTHLGLPKSSGAMCEDGYEFLIDYCENLYNLGLLESDGGTRGNGCGVVQSGSKHGQCYSILAKLNVESSDALITGVSLVVDWVHRSCVVTFTRYETWVDLIIPDMLDFDFILGMDWLASYHDILDYYAKIMTLTSSSVPRIDWKEPGTGRDGYLKSTKDQRPPPLPSQTEHNTPSNG
ncbi:hypothetical protein FXO38_13918 [Capsicum annuum]|nr:hypothetical protein FXO38_13918 [Capsicum annuum]